jgi:hypothetical protein
MPYLHTQDEVSFDRSASVNPFHRLKMRASSSGVGFQSNGMVGLLSVDKIELTGIWLGWFAIIKAMTDNCYK